MTKIKIDDCIVSSMFPSFGNKPVIGDSITISGTIPTGQRIFTKTFNVDSRYFVESYYNKVGSDKILRVGIGWYADIDGVDNNVAVLCEHIGSNYNVNIIVYNYTGSPQTVPTQTINIEVYTFDTSIS